MCNKTKFDFINSLDEDLELKLNSNVYSKDSSNDSFGSSVGNSYDKRDLLLYIDYYVLVNKENNSVVSLKQIGDKTIGLLSKDLSYISNYYENRDDGTVAGRARFPADGARAAGDAAKRKHAMPIQPRPRTYCCSACGWRWSTEGAQFGFPWRLSSKQPACNSGDLGSIPGSGRSPGGGHSNTLQYSCLDRGAWQPISMGSQRVRPTERLRTAQHTRSFASSTIFT